MKKNYDEEKLIDLLTKNRERANSYKEKIIALKKINRSYVRQLDEKSQEIRYLERLLKGYKKYKKNQEERNLST